MQNKLKPTPVLLFIVLSLLKTPCAIHPVAWQPGNTQTFSDKLTLNEKLHTSAKIAINGFYGPEDYMW